jgi:hypothetical protein
MLTIDFMCMCINAVRLPKTAYTGVLLLPQTVGAGVGRLCPSERPQLLHIPLGILPNTHTAGGRLCPVPSFMLLPLLLCCSALRTERGAGVSPSVGLRTERGRRAARLGNCPAWVCSHPFGSCAALVPSLLPSLRRSAAVS